MLVIIILFFIYSFRKISLVVEMYEIIIYREFFIIRREVSDRGEDLFMYYMRILI